MNYLGLLFMYLLFTSGKKNELCLMNYQVLDLMELCEPFMAMKHYFERRRLLH